MARAKKRTTGSTVTKLLAAILGLIFIVGAGGCWWIHSFRHGDRIAPGVAIEGVPVGGLTAAEAKSKVASDWPGGRPRIIRLKCGTDVWDKAAEELGIYVGIDKAVKEALAIGRSGDFFNGAVQMLSARFRGHDVRVPIETDGQKLRQALQGLAQEINRPPTNARVRVVNGEVEIVPEKLGRRLDIEASAKAIVAIATQPSRSEVALVVRTAQPAIKASDLRGFDAVLAEYSTPFDPAKEKRTHNLRLGIAKVNETVLLPGQSFSLNETLGPRLASRGWQEAPTFVNGEVVNTPGGGVCQIATTLYNAALLAGLKITQRHAHSMPVTYVPRGRDATVAWGGPDLRFVNNLAHPILILGWTAGNRLYVRIIGAKEDKMEVELVRSGVETIPAGYKEIPDPSLPPGKKVVEKKGRAGARATLTRIIKRNGQEVKREVLHTDFYAPQPKVVRVGPPAPPAAGPGQPAAGQQAVQRSSPGQTSPATPSQRTTTTTGEGARRPAPRRHE